ncbi:MAG: hypothetical protein ACOCUL_00020 [Bacteroidota bacterium]
MKFKTVHTTLKNRAPHSGCRNMFVVVLLFFISLPGIAANGAVEKHSTPEETKIVYAPGEENSVVITEGRITAEHGKSIKLLPGTHLKGEQPVKLSIVSRGRQQALAYKAEQERKREFHATILERLKETRLTAEVARITGSQLPFPGGTSLWQQCILGSAIPVQSGNSFSAPAIVLRNQITLKNIHNLQASAYRGTYLPGTSWGSCTANIKVMLC